MKRNEPVSHVMTAAPKTVHVHQKLSEVQAMLAEGGFHHVPVVSGSKLVGLLSSADIMKVTYSYGQDARMTSAVLDDTHSVEELMTSDVDTIGPKDTIREAFALLSKGTYHALPVVEDGELVGIVTSTDLLRYTLDQY